jgi:hypothetical protein
MKVFCLLRLHGREIKVEQNPCGVKGLGLQIGINLKTILAHNQIHNAMKNTLVNFPEGIKRKYHTNTLEQ